jgi:hypothetical protein
MSLSKQAFLCFFYMHAIDSLPHFYTVRRYNESGKEAMKVMQSDLLLIAAPTKAGEDFMKQIKLGGYPFIALTNNKMEKLKLEGQGVKKIIQLDTSVPGSSTPIIPDYPIGNIILFEESLTLCCRYIQICRSWTSGSMYVITQSVNPRLIYKGLGADYVIYSKNGDVKFLLSTLLQQTNKLGTV